MKQSLYINGCLADVNDDSLVLFTFQQSDYSNPTAIKNSYTKSFTLPGTPNNNKIFNDIYRFDYYQTSYTFNPSKRTQFEIYNSGELIESGYLKLTKINTYDNNYREYTVNLYGGIGDFMYSLQCDSDGNKLTLADIISPDYFDLGFTINRTTVDEAWMYVNRLSTSKKYGNWDYINFAPCYNGIPESDSFDAKKVALFCGYKGEEHNPLNLNMYKGDTLKKYLPYKVDDYQAFALTSTSPAYSVIEVGDDMDEWEVEDHRSWMQRPVFSIKLLFNAIQSYLRENVNSSFNIKLDETFFNEYNPYYNEMWITLPLLSENKEDVQSNDYISQDVLFADTLTPYDYLTAYTKALSLWYDYDPATKTVYITPRYKFYNNTPVDITGMVETKMKIDPLMFSFRMLKYEWKEGEDNLSEAYEDSTENVYGNYTVSTGWEFDNSSKTVPSDMEIKTAVDNRDARICYTVPQLVYDDTSRTYEIMPSWMWQSDIKYMLFNPNQLDDTLTWDDIHPSLSSSAQAALTKPYYIDGSITGNLNTDGVPKPRFCDDENKAVDGDSVFLMYAGKAPGERYFKYSGDDSYAVSDQQNKVYLTDDIPGIGNVTDGKQIWMNTTPRTGLFNDPLPYMTATTMPMFNRMILDDKNVTWSFDFGVPAQTYVYTDLIYDASATISRKTFLTDYLSDLYNVNTRLVETKMRINDPKSAMHNIYFFKGAHWVIYKITDYSYNSNLSTVQFIKVNDLDNYNKRLLDFSELNVGSSAYLKKFTFLISDYSNISYDTDAGWITCTVNVNTGQCTLYVPELVTATDRTGHVYFTYGTLTECITVNQSGTLSVTPSTWYAGNTAETQSVVFNLTLTQSKDVKCVNMNKWITCSVDTSGNWTVKVSANSTGEVRTGMVSFVYGDHSCTFTVNQSA